MRATWGSESTGYAEGHLPTGRSSEEEFWSSQYPPSAKQRHVINNTGGFWIVHHTESIPICQFYSLIARIKTGVTSERKFTKSWSCISHHICNEGSKKLMEKKRKLQSASLWDWLKLLNSSQVALRSHACLTASFPMSRFKRKAEGKEERS